MMSMVMVTMMTPTSPIWHWHHATPISAPIPTLNMLIVLIVLIVLASYHVICKEQHLLSTPTAVALLQHGNFATVGCDLGMTT